MKRVLDNDSDNDTVCDEEFLEMEDMAVEEANTISVQACEALGVGARFIEEWCEGVVLLGADQAPMYFCDDYPNVRKHAEAAGLELDRLTDLKKIFWYPSNRFPSDLCICPANIIIKGSRARIVHDLSKVGLNGKLYVPGVNYGTMDELLRYIFPGCFIGGLDFQDCFLHWKVHATSCRRLDLRHPITNKVGVFLFLPFGLAPAPGINDANVGEVVRVCKNAVGGLHVVTFVDDLRLVNPQDEVQLRNQSLGPSVSSNREIAFRIVV